MGCQASKDTLTNHEDEILSTKQHQALKSSLEQVQELDSSFKTQGLLLFNNIFDIAPEAKQLFSFKDLTGEEYEEKVKIHGAGVFNIIHKTIEDFGKPQCKARLKALGFRHKERGIVPDHYPVVGKAVLVTLEMALKDKFDEELKSTWSKAFNIIAAQMMNGNY